MKSPIRKTLMNEKNKKIPMGQNLYEIKKKCSVIIFLSINSPSCWHYYILSNSTTWKSLSLWIDLLNYYFILFIEYQFHHSSKVNENKRLDQHMLNSITVAFFNTCNVCNIVNFVALPLMEGNMHVFIICLIDSMILSYHHI